MSGRSIEEWARMCVYRRGIVDCIIGDVCVWRDDPSQCRTKTCSRCTVSQGMDDTGGCIWVWFYPGYYHKVHSFLKCVLIIFNYAVLSANIYFTVKNRKLIMQGNFKCLSKVLRNKGCPPKFAYVRGSQPSCRDAKGFLEVARALNY